ncbi:MAG: hypothetical protein EOP45_14035, partial [Sphingobacteriaceae bacterium]
MAKSEIGRAGLKKRVSRRGRRDKRHTRYIKKGGGLCESILKHRDIVAEDAGDYKKRLTWWEKTLYQTCKYALSRRKYAVARDRRHNQRRNKAADIKAAEQDEAAQITEKRKEEKEAESRARDQLFMTKSKEKQLMQTFMTNFMNRFDRENTHSAPDFQSRRADME